MRRVVMSTRALTYGNVRRTFGTSSTQKVTTGNLLSSAVQQREPHDDDDIALPVGVINASSTTSDSPCNISETQPSSYFKSLQTAASLKSKLKQSVRESDVNASIHSFNLLQEEECMMKQRTTTHLVNHDNKDDDYINYVMKLVVQLTNNSSTPSSLAPDTLLKVINNTRLDDDIKHNSYTSLAFIKVIEHCIMKNDDHVEFWIEEALNHSIALDVECSLSIISYYLQHNNTEKATEYLTRNLFKVFIVDQSNLSFFIYPIISSLLKLQDFKAVINLFDSIADYNEDLEGRCVKVPNAIYFKIHESYDAVSNTKVKLASRPVYESRMMENFFDDFMDSFIKGRSQKYDHEDDDEEVEEDDLDSFLKDDDDDDDDTKNKT